MADDQSDVLDVLVQARGLVSDPARWCRHFLALSEDTHKYVRPSDPKACRWCASGAIARAAGHSVGTTLALRAERQITLAADRLDIAEPGRRSVPTLNDTQDHATVIRLFDEAISALRPCPEKGKEAP